MLHKKRESEHLATGIVTYWCFSFHLKNYVLPYSFFWLPAQLCFRHHLLSDRLERPSGDKTCSRSGRVKQGPHVLTESVTISSAAWPNLVLVNKAIYCTTIFLWLSFLRPQEHANTDHMMIDVHLLLLVTSLFCSCMFMHLLRLVNINVNVKVKIRHHSDVSYVL